MRYILILCAVLFAATVTLIIVVRHLWQKCRAQKTVIDLQSDQIGKLYDDKDRLKKELEIETKHTKTLGEEIARIKHLSIADVMRELSQ